jgi:hypothetical protein
VTSSTLGEPEVDACLAARAKVWKFPKPTEGTTSVKVVQPILLTP